MEYVPVAGIVIHGNGPFARVGLHENDCSVLKVGSSARADEVPVIEKPREGSVVTART